MLILKYLIRLYKVPLCVIRRLVNRLHAYDYPESQGGWRKYGKEPVYGNSNTGTVFDPYVCKFDKSFFMFVSERSTGSIIRLESKNGIKWTNRIVCLVGTDNGSWDSKVNRACILFKDNLWHMWFSAQTEKRSTIGYATSKDGGVFGKVLEYPVLEAVEKYEGVSVMNPCVIWDDKMQIFRMWYAAGENYEPDVICYAESTNGFIWKRHSANPVLKPDRKNKYDKYKVGGCHVVKKGSQYTMFYIGYQNMDVARICEAHSDNGVSWIRSLENPILSPTYNSWDSDAVYKPAVVYNDDSIFVWYNGRYGRKEYIGFAFNNKKKYF